jgi:hypothetical protein
MWNRHQNELDIKFYNWARVVELGLSLGLDGIAQQAGIVNLL